MTPEQRVSPDEVFKPAPNMQISALPQPKNPFEFVDTIDAPIDRFKFQLNSDNRVELIQHRRSTLFFKRGFDVIASLLLLIASSPLFAFTALVIFALKGRRHIILRDARYGLMGKPFNQYIFNVYQREDGTRSLLLHLLWRGGVRLLPSLLNILKGDMSFVGPEPATLEEYRSYGEFEFQRLRVRPGLTCFWFLRRHANLGFDEKIPCDIGYVKKLSFRTDLGILLRSPIVQLMRGSKSVLEERIKILGVKFFNLTMSDALSYVTIAARRRSMWTVSFINADCLNISFRDQEYFNILKQADAVFPDGIGIHLAAQMLGVGLKENTNGTDFFPRLCREVARLNLRLFLLGGEPGVAEAAAQSMRRLVPNVNIVGARDGYFTADEEAGVIASINDLATDILLVGMGVPRQEKWIARTRVRISAGVAIGVGGLFDFYSGKNARAPIWMREIGLEWVYRISQEPRRMWRRYVMGNPLFLYRVLRYGASSPNEILTTKPAITIDPEIEAPEGLFSPAPEQLAKTQLH